VISKTTRNLLVAATLVGGLLAGGDADRELVAMPAWQQVGPEGWAAFSRHADLGNGLLLYPLEAIGGTLLILGAALSMRRNQTAPRAAVVAIWTASVLALFGLALTLKAAPTMLGIKATADPQALRAAFEGFHFWGGLRSVCQVLAFFVMLLALGALVAKKN
jgi:hypothetical protein